MTESIQYTRDPNEWIKLTQVEKDNLRKINTDSSAYHHVDEKCFFCNSKITKNDITPPNQVYDTQNGEIVSHGKCLEYVLKKYPQVPISQLEGQIVRIKVDQSVI